MKKHFRGKEAWLGWIGLSFLQLASFPSIWERLTTGGGTLPPLTMLAATLAGLVLYWIRSFYMRDAVYIVSNTIGVLVNSLSIALVVSLS